jgi:di/tricarboxylate transporter
VTRRFGPAQIAAGLALFAGILLFIFPPAGLEPRAAKAAALAVIAVGFWATSALPEHVTAVGFFTLCMLIGVAPAGVVFGGFESTALWLVFGGLVIGMAMRHTGLGERVASGLVRYCASGYGVAIGGLLVISLVLGFLMPSSLGRVTLLMPIAVALAERLGFEPGSNGRIGMVLAVNFGVHVPTFAILPANIPNMVLVGATEKLYGISPLYGEYLLLHFPVLGLLKTAATFLLIVWLFPDRVKVKAEADHTGRSLSGEQRHLALVLALSLGFWVTDFLHHISPAWISLAAGLFCLIPATRMLPPGGFNAIGFSGLFFVAGIMGLGAVVADTHLGDVLIGQLLKVLPLAPGKPAGNFTALALVATVINPLTTLPGVPAVLTPLAQQMADAAGLPLRSVLMTQVLGFSTIVLPYVSAPLVVGMQLGGERLRHATKLCLWLTPPTLLILWPLDYLWWRLLGWI